MSADVDLGELAKLTENYTGADIAGLVREASLHALKDSISLTEHNSDDNSMTSDRASTNDDLLEVNRKNFLQALQNIRPSVSAEVKNFLIQS